MTEQRIHDGALDGRWRWLAERLAGVPTDTDTATDEMPAAVLLLLYDRNGEAYIVFTRRTENVASHKGEISLPGGMYEADKDPSLVHTALREAKEEVGLDESTVKVLGQLPAVHTMVSNFVIAPVVAVTEQRPRFSPEPTEVAEVLEVPLEALRDPAALQEEDWDLGGEIRRISFYHIGPHKIWGATARIIGEFLAIISEKN